MKPTFLYILCINSLLCLIMASELPLNKKFDLTYMPPLTMSEAEINYIKQQVPYLQRLVNDSIDTINKFDYLREKFNQYEQLDRLKEIKKRVDEVDEYQNPVLAQSLEGQVKILYWLVECSYLHNQLKPYMQNSL
jgi:hypothetical protein